MPSAVLVHAAVFTVGIAVGASTVAAVGLSTWKRSVTTVSASSIDTQPVIQVDKSGSLDVGAREQVLKYGNPGQTLY